PEGAEGAGQTVGPVAELPVGEPPVPVDDPDLVPEVPNGPPLVIQRRQGNDHRPFLPWLPGSPYGSNSSTATSAPSATPPCTSGTTPPPSARVSDVMTPA